MRENSVAALRYEDDRVLVKKGKLVAAGWAEVCSVVSLNVLVSL